MSTRAWITIWLSSLALFAGLAVGPMLLRDHLIALRHDRIFVIGSSLMNYAVPVAGPTAGDGTTSLLGDGRSHLRIGRQTITEAGLLAELDHAIDHRPEIVFVEANPLLFDFVAHAQQRPCDGWKFAAAGYLTAGPERVFDAYRDLRNLLSNNVHAGDPRNITASHRIDINIMHASYPLTFRAPCDQARLSAAVARARAQGTRVILILPPRSPDADRFMGSQETELTYRAHNLARELGVSLYVSRDSWRNSEFVDNAHLNLVGRDHFRRDLQRWWASAQ